MPDTLQVSMLGGFSIRQGDGQIDDRSNRMKKVWLLLAYLIYTRGSRPTQENFLSLIQGSKIGDSGEDPSGRLKALFYRARTLLDQVYPDAGHQLILHQSGAYLWNKDIPLTLDVEEFDRLCSQLPAEEEPRLNQLLQALSLYQGDFLPKLSMEPWAMPIASYYHQQFLTAAEEALTLLTQRSRWQEAAQLCRKALQIEPYSEALYQHRMRIAIAMGDRAEAANIYEQMSELLFDTFGVMPSEESRQLYREACRQSNQQNVSIGTVRDQLREATPAKGAMFCEYDFFKMLYQVQARSMIRTGDVVHIALLSLHAQDRKPLPRRSLDTAMENLKQLVLGNLRQGDVVTQCNMSQLVLMLPQANYENSCAVCQRVIKAFCRQYPHSPAQIHYSVHPLEPMMPDNRTP